MANQNDATKVVTGVVRLSYANVWEPVSINGGTPKFSVSLIIPKDDEKTLTAINAAIDAAIKDGVSKFGGKIPNRAALKLPLRDGDTERDDEAYKGSYFVNANSTTAPQIVDRTVQPIATYVFLSTNTWLMSLRCRGSNEATADGSFANSPSSSNSRANAGSSTAKSSPSYAQPSKW